jgi:hypothetical protein
VTGTTEERNEKGKYEEEEKEMIRQREKYTFV